MTKPWYASKVIWTNVVATLVAIYSLMQVTPLFPANWLPYFGIVVGVLNIILRYWFTDSTLTS
jgi:hypothetical protein